MALKLLQPGMNSLGQFDALDSQLQNFKGGEIATFTSVVATSATDHAAEDVFDGYDQPNLRPAVTLTVATGSRPLMLTDDGILGYGTLFGEVVGGTAGQQVNGPNTFTGAILGPSTQIASGKITLWEKPGLYAVSLDAVDTNITTGLQPSNPSLLVGAPISYTTSGILTPVATGVGQQTTVVARLIEFTTNGSLVTTPNSLVAALNSPSGNVSSVGPRTFSQVVIYFNPPN